MKSKRLYAFNAFEKHFPKMVSIQEFLLYAYVFLWYKLLNTFIETWTKPSEMVKSLCDYYKTTKRYDHLYTLYNALMILGTIDTLVSCHTV